MSTIHPVQGATAQVPALRKYHIHLRGVEAAATCKLGGTYAPEARTLSLEPVLIKPSERFVIKFFHLSFWTRADSTLHLSRPQLNSS